MLKKKINKLPDISVLVCTYNHATWIERCIRSLLNQNYINSKDFEIILIDDASKDESLQILKNFNDIINLKIIRNKKNLGLPKSLNKAIKNARGRYLVRVDSDDYVSRNFLFLSKLFLDMNREYQAVATDYIKVDHFEKIISKENSLKKPINYYGFTKLCLEKFILKNKKQFRYKIGIARIFNYYNSSAKKGFFVNDIIKHLKSKKK